MSSSAQMTVKLLHNHSKLDNEHIGSNSANIAKTHVNTNALVFLLFLPSRKLQISSNMRSLWLSRETNLQN